MGLISRNENKTDMRRMAVDYAIYCAETYDQVKKDVENLSQIYYWRDFGNECFAEYVLDRIMPGWRDYENRAIGALEQMVETDRGRS